MKQPKFTQSFEVVRRLPGPLADLKKIAANFRWTWDHASRDLFRAVDKALWLESEHNPTLFLNRVPQARLDRLATDDAFLDRLRAVSQDLDEYLAAPTWYSERHPDATHGTIAYFCFEFGITEGLPIYSGGLGVLAGDHLKAASDLGLPLVGIGLLYNRGYFRQRIGPDGWQREVYPNYDFSEMPLTLVRGEDGAPVRIEVEFPDRTVGCQIWRADVGRVPLYLLDSNLLENAQSDQGITDSLYSGDEEMRIRQEMILGIGGLRALRALGIQPSVCHLNEGHAAFLSLERIRQAMTERGMDFRTARQATVSGNVFTTHTPVPAGFDRFPPALLERYLGRYAGELGVGFHDVLRLGRFEENDPSEPFNMALLAMSNANRVNGVAKLHAEVSRGMFARRWPGWPEGEVPIRAVTNGIHTTTWISRRMAALFDEHLGSDWRRHPERPDSWAAAHEIPDDDLWIAMDGQRSDLVRYVRKRLDESAERADYGVAGQVLDPRILTIGFARRFATYKRGSLMLADRERLRGILFHPDRPVQIVVAGKSHPRDDGGKHIIQDLWRFTREENNGSRLVFLEDYDMGVARQLVQGVDVWLNNPRRPYEASGTSGMKVVPNGGLNVSILDGWWDEAYTEEVGWAIGDRDSASDEGHQDWLDSRALYRLIESDVAPLFYQRGADGVPHGWLAKVKSSIAALAPFFNTGRMVADYAEECYFPAALDQSALAEEGKAAGILAWRDRVGAAWGGVRVRSTSNDAPRVSSLGDPVRIEAVVELNGLSADDVAVEAIVGKVGSNRELAATRVEPLAHVGERDGAAVYAATFACDVTGYQGYAVRVVPRHPLVAVPAELQWTAWA